MGQCVSIAIDKLTCHPDNPNRMSKANFNKLFRNIERAGRYEPLIVRPDPKDKDCFQIINGHHRAKALAKLGREKADCIIWDVDDEQTQILLATLNRLSGSDVPVRKIALLKKLAARLETKQLSRLLPYPAKQLERLAALDIKALKQSQQTNRAGECFVNPLVFFVSDEQKQAIETALELAGTDIKADTKAAKRATALTLIAGSFCQTNRLQSPERK